MLMECYKIYTSLQSCPAMSMTGALLPSALERAKSNEPSELSCKCFGTLGILGTAYQQEKSLSRKKEKQKA